MLPQNKVACPVCEDCPMFSAFDSDTRSRGLCKLFDKVVRGYHEMAQDCRNNMDEIILILHSNAIESDPDNGLIGPKRIEELSVFLPHDDVNQRSIVDTWEQYAPQFEGFYLFDWIWYNNPNQPF